MNNPYNQQQQRQDEIVLDGTNVTTLIVAGAKSFAKKHKVISGSYLFGILILLIAGSGTKLSIDQRRQYDHIMSTIDLNAEHNASVRYGHAYHAYKSSKGWFTCDSLCQRNKEHMQRAEADLNILRKEGYNRMSDAKAVAGLFSEVGVGEVKDSFWEYFYAGKNFAKRQSMWDAMFMGMRSMSRDESMVEYMLKMLIQVLINFSLGLLMALVIFIFGLWSIIKSYQPNPLTAVAFFLSAACAAFAFVSTYLFLVYGAAAGGLYGTAKIIAANGGRIEGPGDRRRYQNVRNRPHYY
mmetsp:Transcript_9882/g.14456  ORF Transcript_9882/g.14456 Transcript_9882/m.14456 type:complete len:295 (-) Transcript_9882:558-1442(-)